jgi:membrane protein DedA with SNARE-associated domain
VESVFGWIAHYGYVGIFGVLMLGIIGIPVPDETLLVFTGYLIFKQELAPLPAFGAALMGSLGGITVSYAIGRTLGLYLVNRLGHLLHLDAEKLEQVRAWYERRGKYGLVLGYFIPGIRHLAAYIAGSSKLPVPVFATYAYLGGFLWSGTFITVGYVLGDEWQRMSSAIHRYLLIGAGLATVAIAIGFVVLRHRQQTRRTARRPLAEEP